MAERRVGWGGHTGVMRLLAVSGALLLAVSAQQPLKLKVGDDVTLVPQYTGDPSEINWKINSNKLVDMERKPQVDFKFYRLEDRATISENGRLTIKNLTIGDSGDYKAEALVNNIYQITDIRLDVLGCPDEPTITEKSTKDRIVLSCHSSTPGVTYEWQTNRKSVIKNQLYNESRLQEDETFTCFVDNGVCKKNVSITISYIAESRSLSGGAITGIVIGVLILILILILIIILLLIALCYQYRDNPCVKPIYSFLTSNKESRVKIFERVHSYLCCCKGNPDKEEQHRLLAQSEQVKEVGSDVTLMPQYTGNLSAIHWKKDGEKLVDMDPDSQDNTKFERLQDRVTINKDGSVTIKNLTVEDSGVYTAVAVGDNVHQNTEITLTVCESCNCITVKFQDPKKEKVIQSLTIHNVKPEDHGHYNVEVLQSDGKKNELDIEETEGDLTIRTKDDRVTLTVADAEKLVKITLKKGGVTLFQWRFSGLKLHTNNIGLEPGSVTVHNAEGNGLYKVEFHSADNAFQLEGNNQVNEFSTTGEVPLKEVKVVPSTENGLPGCQCNITFHPIKMTNKAPITWKKDGQQVDVGGDRFKSGPNGDLTINNVTPNDGGKYTVHCGDQEQEQEFNLHL